MKMSINAVIVRCTLFYFQYFLQLTLELVLILFYFHWYLKKDPICANNLMNL